MGNWQINIEQLVCENLSDNSKWEHYEQYCLWKFQGNARYSIVGNYWIRPFSNFFPRKITLFNRNKVISTIVRKQYYNIPAISLQRFFVCILKSNYVKDICDVINLVKNYGTFNRIRYLLVSNSISAVYKNRTIIRNNHVSERWYRTL